MRLLPRQLLLLNLEGKLGTPDVHPRGFSSPEEAHDSLVRMTGIDLGYDAKIWRRYLEHNFMSTDEPRPTLLVRLLRNCNGEIAAYKADYLPREQAYEQLQRLTGQDFGGNIEMLQQWMQQNLARNRRSGRHTYMMELLLQQFQNQRNNEEAYSELKALTGQDFGRDMRQWKTWIDEHIPDVGGPNRSWPALDSIHKEPTNT